MPLKTIFALYALTAPYANPLLSISAVQVPVFVLLCVRSEVLLATSVLRLPISEPSYPICMFEERRAADELAFHCVLNVTLFIVDPDGMFADEKK